MKITADKFAEDKGMSRMGRLSFFKQAGITAATEATAEEFEAMLKDVQEEIKKRVGK